MYKPRNTGGDALLGIAIGDALGVPVEFLKREDIDKNPVLGMRGLGTHKQPVGTWSDDTSLTMCLAESLLEGFNSERIGKSFVGWFDQNHWTAHNQVFDIGNTTKYALQSIKDGVPAEEAGPTNENSQGNGSLMRIMPLLFYTYNLSPHDRWDITRRVSAITHGHINCAIACFIYLEFARWIISPLTSGDTKLDHLGHAIGSVRSVMDKYYYDLSPFERILNHGLNELQREEIKSSGYVVHTLEASIWCYLNTADFNSAVLKAVNLGDDSDTTGAVTGGLAALKYGLADVPHEWLDFLARRWDIYDVGERLEAKYKLSTWGK